jgi:hypothetical protein
MMSATTNATYAVLAAYSRKILRPVEMTAVVIFAAAVAGATYLIVSFSAWWWLLMLVVILYGVLGSILWLILRYTLDKITPEQTAKQQMAVKAFIVKSSKVADTLGISQFALLLRIVQDVLHRKQSNILTEFAKDSNDLKHEFEKVIQAFAS